tara:strand:+ start:80 stop:250 length:171 start_codon:yes stop_codon:yes gene_type:complete
MDGWIDCPECDGTGLVKREKFISQSMNNPYGFPDIENEECEDCGGIGNIEPPEEDE